MTGKRGSEDLKTCPVCSAKLRPSKLEGHLRNVHGESVESLGESRAESRGKGRRSERRKAELAKRNRSRAVTAVACAVFVIAVLAAVYMLRDHGGSAGPAPVQTPPPQTTSTIEIATSELTTSAKFYSYTADGISMRYFAVLGADGEIHVALDACDVCYAEKKGYRQVGDVMRCNNCGKEFAISSIGTENLSGGCWPSYMPIDTQGGDVVIQKSDLVDKKFMFA